MMQSQADQWKEHKALLFVLYHWHVQDFRHHLQQRNRDGLRHRTTPEIFVPFKLNSHLSINHFSCWNFAFKRHIHILKIHRLQHDVNICWSVLLVLAWLWFLSNRNTFIVKIEIKKDHHHSVALSGYFSKQGMYLSGNITFYKNLCLGLT